MSKVIVKMAMMAEAKEIAAAIVTAAFVPVLLHATWSEYDQQMRRRSGVNQQHVLACASIWNSATPAEHAIKA